MKKVVEKEMEALDKEIVVTNEEIMKYRTEGHQEKKPIHESSKDGPTDINEQIRIHLHNQKRETAYRDRLIKLKEKYIIDINHKQLKKMFES